MKMKHKEKRAAPPGKGRAGTGFLAGFGTILQKQGLDYPN